MKTVHWPVGLSTGCFYHTSIFEVLEAVRDSGFQDIEVCSYPHHLDYHQSDEVQRAGQRLRELELRPYSFHAPFGNHIDITAEDSVVREASIRELIIACEAAASLGAMHVVLHPGPEKEGRPPEHEFIQRMRHAAGSLNVVANRCCGLGLQLLLENMLPHLLFGHTSDMMYLLGETRSCIPGACLDTGHAHLSGDLATVVHKLSGHLRMLHCNDNLGDRDSHLAPGEGAIDWPWLIAELQRSGFNGALILEISSRPGESVSDTLTRARRSRDYLLQLAATAEERPAPRSSSIPLPS